MGMKGFTQALGLSLAVGLALVWPAAAQDDAASDDDVEIREWDVPWAASRPRDPAVEDASRVWFVGQRSDYFASLNPETGVLDRVDLPDGTGPHNLIVDSGGIVWIAGNRKAFIGRYDPARDELEQIPMPDPAARDPHTLILDSDESHIWFTVQGGNFVGRLTLADWSVDLIAVKTPRARPYGIAIAPDGTPWIALFGTNKLAEVDPETLALTEHLLPRINARPRRLGVTADGRVWYVDYAGGQLGVFDPESGAFREWGMPSGDDARPYGMAVDSQDRIWFVETGPSPNNFVGFDPRAESFFSITPVPSGAGAIRHMDYHQPSGTIWFGTDANTIGRARVE